MVVSWKPLTLPRPGELTCEETRNLMSFVRVHREH